MSYEYARSDFLDSARWRAGFAVVSAVAVVAVFGWELAALLLGTLIGIVIWGAVEYFCAVKARIPGGPLPELPSGVVVGDEDGRSLAWRVLALVLVTALMLLLAWLADSWDLGAVFVPGQMAGYAVGALLGAWLLARWERRNGVQVVVQSDDEGDETLFATPAG